jgi:hypothetical protein
MSLRIGYESRAIDFVHRTGNQFAILSARVQSAMTMTCPFANTKSIRMVLCWLLAFVLVLNGALSPIMAQTMLNSATGVSLQASSTSHTHCHEKNASAPSKSVDADTACPCCDGSSCDCSCISVASIPVLFLNLRPLSPVIFVTQWMVPPAPVSPPGRLLRPPIA